MALRDIRPQQAGDQAPAGPSGQTHVRDEALGVQGQDVLGAVGLDPETAQQTHPDRGGGLADAFMENGRSPA